MFALAADGSLALAAAWRQLLKLEAAEHTAVVCLAAPAVSAQDQKGATQA